MAEIVFTNDAVDDLRRIGPDAVPKILKKVLLLQENVEAGYPLGGELTGYRKLIVGRNTWRIVYRITKAKTVEICEVWAIGPQADAEIYAEAVTRVGAATESRPEFVSIAGVLERLGRAAAIIGPARATHAEPVPDWLAQRLIHTAGMAREDVAALDLQAAVDAWTAFISNPR